MDRNDEEEVYGDQQQQQWMKQKSFLRLLLDHNKSKDQGDHEMLTKEGSRWFMGLVRRISLVGRHERAQSYGLHQHQQPLNYLSLSLILRWIFFCFLGS